MNYYEERLVDGVLQYRHSPTGKWVRMTEEQLSMKVVQYQRQIEIMNIAMDKLLEEVR